MGGGCPKVARQQGGERVHGDKADGFYLKDITHDISCSDVDDMIQAHKEREEAGGGQMDTDEATGTRDEEPPAKRPRSGTGRSAWRSSPKK